LERPALLRAAVPQLPRGRFTEGRTGAEAGRGGGEAARDVAACKPAAAAAAAGVDGDEFSADDEPPHARTNRWANSPWTGSLWRQSAKL